MFSRKLFILVFTIMCSLTGCNFQKEHFYKDAQDGVIDLTSINLEKESIPLNGEWEFYENQLLKSDEIGTKVSKEFLIINGTWNSLSTRCGTYRLRFISGESERLALKLPFINTPYKLWINEELVATGIVGESDEELLTQYLPQIAFFESKRNENEILLQISDSYNRGMVFGNILLGSERNILDMHYNGLAADFILLGCTLSIGLYNIILFFIRKKNAYLLYFGLLCILGGIGGIQIGQHFNIPIYPEIIWQISNKRYAMIYALELPLILMFYLSVCPQYFNDKITKFSQISCFIFCIAVIALPVKWFVFLFPIYSIIFIAAIVYDLWVSVKVSLSTKENGNILIIIGTLSMIFIILNYPAFPKFWLGSSTILFLKSMIGFEKIIFIIQLAFLFSVNIFINTKIYSVVVEEEKSLSYAMVENNLYLDELVEKRTRHLAESTKRAEQKWLELERINKDLKSLSFKDPLTGLWNRRKYDESIKNEWNKCLRSKRSISMILIDIDFYKMFNDIYGHMEGDKCLVSIGKVIKRTLYRPTDIAARYGGEEFVILLSETEKEETERVANIIREKIELLNIPHKGSPISNFVTASIGVATTVPTSNSSYEYLFVAADEALYKAKASGRNRVNVFKEKP